MTAIGIDLGTTNSVVAWCVPGRREPKVLSNSLGENLTPSVVGFRRPKREGEKGEILVGREALSYGPMAPADTILSIKRLMGRDYDDPQIVAVRGKFNYRVVPAADDDPGVRVELGGELHTPVEISAMILRKLKDDASRALGEPVTHAVITVPAYFNEGQRAATRQAGLAAGLVVKKIIDEPTAAAITFGLDAEKGARHRILVYDLGGGTFDISILQMVRGADGHNQFEVLHTEGDNWLGGDDFDRPVFERILAAVESEAGEDPTHDKRFLFEARKHAEAAKRALGHSAHTDIVLPAAYRTTGQNALIDVELELSREELEEMIRERVEHSMGLVQKALGAQNLGTEDLTDVLLVGGSTLVPAVYRAVQGLFGEGRVRRSLNPMECVALGASILAANLRGLECPDAGCGELNDEAAEQCQKCGASLASARAVEEHGGLGEVTAMALGIAAVQGEKNDVFVPIIPKSTPYPLQESMRRRFKATNERFIKVPVYEGDDPVASRNAEQGVIQCDLPREIDPETEVEVCFNYDRNRELTVSVRIPGGDFFKTETLRRDQPRTSRKVSSTGEPEPEVWQDTLADTIDFAQRFLESYQAYMETSQSMKMQRDIDRGKQILVFTDEMEGRRMVRVLQAHVFNSGLATQLFLAYRATAGASKEEARLINEAEKAVREHYDKGEREEVEQKARLLKVLIGRTLERRAGIKEIADQESYDGLLRLLGE